MSFLETLLGSVFIALGSLFSSPNEALTTIAFLDVGQGDSIFIQGPTGHQVLIDGGKSGTVLGSLSKIMPAFDRSIDMVIGTHGDSDHIGGLSDVLSAYDVSLVALPIHKEEKGDMVLLRERAEKEGGEIVYLTRGDSIDLGGPTLSVLFPDRDDEGVIGRLETNTSSLFLRLQHEQVSLLLTGDAPSSVEEYVVSICATCLKSTLLKLGHHGSRTSSSEGFLSAVHPEMAIVSVGKDNSYGHPHKEVTDRLVNMNIPFLETSKEGTIVFQTDGKTLWRK